MLPLPHSLAWFVLSVGAPAAPVDGVAPLDDMTPTEFITLPTAGANPFHREDLDDAPPPRLAPTGGAAPLDHLASADPGEGQGPPPPIAAPLGAGPPSSPPPADPRRLRLVRIEVMTGPVWRIRRVESMLTAGVEFGRVHGFSATFHTSILVAPDRSVIGVHDVPIGLGGLHRWRFGEAVDLSVGLSAGVMVHRAATDLGVVHRVDPDLRLPIRFAWTGDRFGLSVAVLQGYSVRDRSYVRRGVEVWTRIPYRIGLVIGLHFDAGVGSAGPRRPSGRRREVP